MKSKPKSGLDLRSDQDSSVKRGDQEMATGAIPSKIVEISDLN
jgi:hypothetical protein